MAIIKSYYCSSCHRQIDGIGESSGRLDNCPHCGAFLTGLNARHISDLNNRFLIAILLTIFFVIAAVAAPPTLAVSIITGIWAYRINKKLNLAKGKSQPYSKERQRNITSTDKRFKSKTVALLLAIFTAFFTWLYTYEDDSRKFWLNLGLTLVTLGFWIPIAWIWAIVEVSKRPEGYYTHYNPGSNPG
jgi:4-hydroxybenzoate polyprenyltransferase